METIQRFMGGFLRDGTIRHSTRLRREWAIAGVLAGLALAGCAELEKEFQIREGSGLARLLVDPVSEEDVARALERSRSVELPARLAVYEIDYLEPWEEPEANLYVDSLIDRLSAQRRLFPSVAAITPLVLAGRPELLRLRHAAARSQSELVLVSEIDRRAESRASPLVFFNLLLVGLAIPSETVVVEVRVQGHVIETQSGFFLGTFRGDAVGEEFVPTLGVDSAVEDLTRRLAAEAYGKMASDLFVRIGQP